MFSDLADRRLLFCINSGRSGSKYLATLLGSAAGVRSFHEAEPKMNLEFTQWINTLPYDATRERREVKAAAIAGILRGMGPGEVYAETNHMFIKTFYDVVLAAFPQAEVIVLRRSLPRVLKSFIEMGYFSALNPRGPEWMSSPNAVTAALPAIGPDTSLDPYDASIAYLLDVEARAQRFRAEYPSVPVHEVRLEEIVTPEGASALFARLGLTPGPETEQVVGTTVNDRLKRKEQLANPTTLEECRRRLELYRQRAAALGVAIPESAAFE